jgi:uncharacterized membrane protein YhaH (DUF805 family)
MMSFRQRYWSFTGRLARLPFFARGIFLGVVAAAIFIASIPFFSQGGIWWWIGILVAAVALAVLGVGATSLMVRRLHDVGLSGYHAIWVGAAELGWTVLSYGPPLMILLGLPLAAIGLWLTFWPGNQGPNRFGEAPG